MVCPQFFGYDGDNLGEFTVLDPGQLGGQILSQPRPEEDTGITYISPDQSEELAAQGQLPGFNEGNEGLDSSPNHTGNTDESIKVDPNTGGVTPSEELPNTYFSQSNESLIITPAGVAVGSNTITQQGTSGSVGDFNGIEGASVEEIISRIPSDWVMVPQDRGQGVKWVDSNGNERIRMHGPSVRAPAGSNSQSGWTIRIHDPSGGNQYLDNEGNSFPSRTNETHIPIKGNPNAK